MFAVLMLIHQAVGQCVCMNPWREVEASAACQCESTDNSFGISTAIAYMSLLVKSAPKP